MEKMKIEIWSDIACPYCYIGKRKLETVLSRLSYANDIEIIWHAYELDPLLPNKFLMNYRIYLAEKFNMTEDEVAAYMQKITGLAKKEDLDFNIDKIIVTRTHDALRLTKLAAKYGVADNVEEMLFQAYFTEGKNISEKKL